MKNWMKCCFPNTKEDLQISNKVVEYKDDDSLSQSKANTQNKDNQIQKSSLEEKNASKASSNQKVNKTNKNDNSQTDTLPPKKDSIKDDKTKVNNKPSQNPQEQFLESINANNEVSNEEIKKAPILTLTEEEGDIFNGKEIKITAGGLIGGRNCKDGVSIFGISNRASGEGNKESFKNDFELNYSNSNLQVKHYPYIFVIYYDRDKKDYFIRAYTGKGSTNMTLFVKLTNNYDLPLKQKEIIFSGTVLFQITPSADYKSIEIASLNKKDGQNPLCHTFDESKTKEVTIGRDSTCTFAFPKDKAFSKIQTTLYYDEQKKYWIIMDGCKMRSSTNGTWAFVIHSFPIQDQMIVEILTAKIKISLSGQK